MESQPTPTPTTRFGRIKAFVSANQTLCFMAVLLLVATGIITYLGVSNGQLQKTNDTLTGILVSAASRDSTARQVGTKLAR